MDIIPGGRSVRSLAIATCILISSTWAAVAQAQYDPYSKSEKELRTTEPVAVRTTQHLGSANQFCVPGKPAIVEGRLFSYDVPPTP